MIAKQKLEVARLSIELGKAERKAKKFEFEALEERAETKRLKADLKLAAVRAEEDRMFLTRCKRLLLEVMVILPDDEPFKQRQAQVLQDPLLSDIRDRTADNGGAASRVREDVLFSELSERVNNSPFDTSNRIRKSFGSITTPPYSIPKNRSGESQHSTGGAARIQRLLTETNLDGAGNLAV